MMTLVKRNKPTNTEINNLSSNEKQLYDRLIYLSGLHKQLDHQSHNKTIDELKNKMKLIEGEINAGNNSPLLLKELYVICHSLHNFGLLHKKDMNEYLKQFK
jgi:hypothetical protein